MQNRFHSTHLDPNKKAQEFKFSREVNKNSHPVLTFNNNNIVNQALLKRHCSIILGNCFSFEELNLAFSKVNKTIGLLSKLQCVMPRSAILTITELL